jgi:hypothetical protein
MRRLVARGTLVDTDALQLADAAPLLARSLRLAAFAEEAFQHGADIAFDGWQALCALQSSGNARRWALLRLECSKVHGLGVDVPASLHLVPLQVCALVQLSCCGPLSHARSATTCLTGMRHATAAWLAESCCICCRLFWTLQRSAMTQELSCTT